MVADQRRKRLNGPSIAGGSASEQNRVKKRKLEPLANGLNSNSHISLEWDGNQKKVVARKEQVGISRRNYKPYNNSVPDSHSALADVVSIPKEVFELENLSGVLSYEVWQTHLSEDERSFLTQFLPSGQNTEQVVEALLDGDNFHFGNSFLKWSASLCSGDLHPDETLCHEKCLKAEKKAYYSQLQAYHDGIIEYLQKLKERWEGCRDPEKEILPKIWRSRRDVERRISSNAGDSRLHDFEQDVTATSESGSWLAEEKAWSSDNQNTSVMKGGEPQRRSYKKGTRDKCGSLLIASDDVMSVGAKSRKGEKLNKRNIHHSDGAKYMSCIKISKKQLQLVKSMKQSGKSIQIKALNRVLGNLDSLHVESYEVFVEEEQKKLHEHWVQLAKEDLPSAYNSWRERKLQLSEVIKSLGEEMKDKLKSHVEFEDEENSGIQEEEEINSESSSQDQNDIEASDEECDIKDDGGSVPTSPSNQSIQQNPSPNDSHGFSVMDLDNRNNHVISKSGNSLSNISGHSGEMNTADDAATQEVHLSPGGDVWQAVNRHQSYYDSSTDHEFTTSGLPLVNPQANQDQRTHLITLEADLHREEDLRKDLMHRHPNGGSSSSYQNQDGNELLQSVFKSPSMISYVHEQKQSGINFQPQSNELMANDSQFPANFQGQKRLDEAFMQQNVSENIYVDRGRYLIPRPEDMQMGSIQNNWPVNPVRISEPIHPHFNGGDLLSHNWFSSENQVRGGWSGSTGVSIPSQSIGNGGNSDQSLFSVLSHCNQLSSGLPYDSMGTPEQFIAPRNYGLVSNVAPGISNNTLPHPSHPLDYLGGRNPSTPMINDEIGWINLPHQNPALQDSIGKPPYLRSWNQ